MDKQLEKILVIIQNILKKKQFDSSGLTLDSNLRALGFDSLDLAELTVRIENEFGIDIFEDGIIETVKEIINKIELEDQ